MSVPEPSSNSGSVPWRPGDSVPRKILEEVLRQTVSAQSDVTVDPRDLELLREVAARYRGYPFGLEPVLLEMVRISLEGHLPGLVSASESREMALRIARTLYEDAVSRARLERLWMRLTTANP